VELHRPAELTEAGICQAAGLPRHDRDGSTSSLNAGQQLFVASAIKVFVLVEALRQDDSPDVVATIADRQLPLDASVWSFDSPVLNAPELTGTVSERTAMAAMISHSDNTATDIMLKHVGPDSVRSFLASAGLSSSAVPDSTRSFIGYLKGAPDYLTFTWERLVATADDPFVNPALNPTSTLASSADDLVSLYSRAMPGEFFEHAETLNSLRTTLSMGDLIWVVPFPLGATSFGKGGGFDAGTFHAVCAPGALCFDDVWLYFAFILNWDTSTADADPATLAAFLAATADALQVVKDSLDGRPNGPRLPGTR
jgi:beta-lactamase class A